MIATKRLLQGVTRRQNTRTLSRLQSCANRICLSISEYCAGKPHLICVQWRRVFEPRDRFPLLPDPRPLLRPSTPPPSSTSQSHLPSRPRPPHPRFASYTLLMIHYRIPPTSESPATCTKIDDVNNNSKRSCSATKTCECHIYIRQALPPPTYRRRLRPHECSGPETI